MKKIIALLTLFVLTFTSGYATTGDTVNLTTYDILKTNIFYINGQGYIKENGNLKKVNGIKFYSIAGQRYVNDNGNIIKVSENKIYKINDINYVKQNNNLVTLDKYLKTNLVKKSTENKEIKTVQNIKKTKIKLTVEQKELIRKKRLEIAKNNKTTNITTNKIEKIKTIETAKTEPINIEATDDTDDELGELFGDLFKDL